ncbi:sensor histidine kinase [Oceanobacillus neutriphilus]|uniref:histidine kinase n=1 Tax=Oceanobacillus neutriphilus TaxID=531815 RepID=A0ABQ2P253_9BACI|nr:HAMP domain-containing sensor histidine kinase [Oceanobacillus neutriphilus]GGP16377.1 two-component sensor histidine kinase [Oceanobacillus neutriphilus]
MKNDKVLLLIIFQFFILTGTFIVDINSHSGDALKWSLYIILFLISTIFFILRFRYLTQLKRVNIELRRAVDGNVRTRLLTKHDKVLDEFVFSINELVEQLEKVQVQSIKSEKARKGILSGISHDIRTPLTSIIGYVDALKDDIAVSEAEKKAYLEIISRKANGLKQLIDELFHMAKIDADEITLKKEQLDFAEITRECLIEFLPDLEKKNMALKTIIPEEKYIITADCLSLKRIIGNLIKNAVHYGSEGKILGVELIETSKDYQLLIWDQGPGIAGEDMMHVFEKMYRGDQSRNLLSGGSGLGLSIAKTLVEKHHGKIWVESIPWKRTTFGFSIPKNNSSSFS